MTPDAPADLPDPLDPLAHLDEALLDRIRSRAPGYDARNAFFAEDLDELRAAGHLRLLVPRDLGGSGASLSDAVRAQHLLAQAAPATALGVGMHLVWTAVARILDDRGDDSLRGVLQDAGRDELLAFAISEPGNDQALADALTRAEPDADGGYRFTGTKSTSSMAPAWTRLGLFGRDDTDPERPLLVHAFVPRDAPGLEIAPDWDTLGMRATQSHTVILRDVRAEPADVVRRREHGRRDDPFVLAVLQAFELLIAAVYTGIGQRALDLAVESALHRTSRAAGGATLAADPGIRHLVAEAALAQDALLPQLTALADDVDRGADHGDRWASLLVGAKVRATRTAADVVQRAIAVAGGGSFRTGDELGRLYRDVLAGGFHPSSDRQAAETIATTLLGPVPRAS
ncbi:acyl-CoA dehydrogenase family protein [Clavibacter sp. VKM Ac-2542]|uniref:acyl-CoA dehydrogenase family protein n=1 Tax=Clavibacter sp. VKM Ac-2542 TaxID=2783811 RepID=UPI00188B9A06|nr:acyl-CoA dehydrogenase family protein [Clavibacter sp. VKM Ac-2542]MBF4619802.1 acyl-CoA/acyl-ACP dehydrogenase [Clavibacter sp. VKM Ac-2542]